MLMPVDLLHPAFFFIYSWLFLAALRKSSYLWGCKTNEWRSEVSGGEGRACLLARSSLASHPLASCQLRCPLPSLSPLRQTGCQCRGGQHAPQNKHTHCQFLLSLYLSICRPSASQVWKTGKQMDKSGVGGRALPADEAQTSTVQEKISDWKVPYLKALCDAVAHQLTYSLTFDTSNT